MTSRTETVSLRSVNALKFLLAFSLASHVVMAAAPEAPPKLTPKDFTVLPYTSTLSTEKLDPKAPKIFDELEVTTSSRIRIHGKKKYDAGWVGTALHYHLGKVVLAPPGDRTGKLSAKQPSGSDSVSYYIVLDLGDALSAKWVKLEKGKVLSWTLKTEGEVKKFSVSDGTKEVATLSAPVGKVAGFGFAATARWAGNEVDLAVEFD